MTLKARFLVPFGCTVLALLAATAPINHDEDQYIGAAMLSRTGRPFVDFLHLQTPLQPWLSAPLLSVAPGRSFLVLRLATAGLAALFLMLVYRASRQAGAPRNHILTATLLVACTYAFLFSAGVFRNDLLPAVFAAASMLFGLVALRNPNTTVAMWFLAGLGLGLATSTKISYAVPLVAAGIFLALELRNREAGGIWRIAAYGLGGFVGLSPALWAWLAAPEAFWYGVIDYARRAPLLWYASIGYGRRLTVSAKLIDSLIISLRGPILIALVVWLRQAGQGWRHKDPAFRFLDLLIAGGIVAALLPTPTWRQYFVPLLAPLFVRCSRLLPPKSKVGRALLLVCCVAGAAPEAVYLGQALTSGSTPVGRATQEAHWIGAEVRARGESGAVATLSPHLVLDSGLSLDPGFANGPFFYRTGDSVDPAMAERLHAATPRTLSAWLHARSPEAIVVGYENRDHLDQGGLDLGLARYASSRGFVPRRSPFGKAILFLPDH